MYDNTVHHGSEISRQLRARREEIGLSLAQLARRADTSAATLSRYETGWSRFEVLQPMSAQHESKSTSQSFAAKSKSFGKGPRIE